MVRIRYRPGNARAALGLLCAWCLQACSRSQHAAFVPFVVGGRGAPALGCGGGLLGGGEVAVTQEEEEDGVPGPRRGGAAGGSPGLG